MGESLIQPCRVQEEGPLDRKLLLYGDKDLLYAGLQVPYE